MKDTFSLARAERIEWIGIALSDAVADRFVGWDKKTKSYDRSRRVTLVCGNYVVVIAIIRPGEANFVTAFVADTTRVILDIRQGPRLV